MTRGKSICLVTNSNLCFGYWLSTLSSNKYKYTSISIEMEDSNLLCRDLFKIMILYHLQLKLEFLELHMIRSVLIIYPTLTQVTLFRYLLAITLAV